MTVQILQMNLQWTNSIKVEQKIGQPIKHIYDLFSSRQKAGNFSENQTICKQKKTKVISKRKNADQVMTKEHKFKGKKKKKKNMFFEKARNVQHIEHEHFRSHNYKKKKKKKKKQKLTCLLSLFYFLPSTYQQHITKTY